MDFLDVTPQQEQQLLAQALRSKQLLGENSQKANRFGNFAAIAQLANNPEVARAAIAAHKNAQDQYGAQSLGAQGFALPATGEFVESPMYQREKMLGRNQQVGLQNDRLAAQQQALADRLAAQQQMQAERLQAQAFQAEQNRALRGTLAAVAASNRSAGAEDKAATRAAKEAVGKTLPAPQVEKLSKNMAVADAYKDLSGSFKEEWAGSPLLGNAQNALGRFVGAGYEDQANWWQRYQEQTNLVRNQLFGSALTASEKEAFDRANIVPGMKPSEIKRRLAQQAEVTQKGVRRLTENYGKAGYNVSDLLPTDAASAAPQAPGLQLPPGFKVIGPAP